MPPGRVTLTAIARGYRKYQISDLRVPEGEDLSGLELTLERGATVEGQIRAPGGAPLEGVAVSTLPAAEGGFAGG